MAIKTNTYTTYDVKGTRESLSDVISNIAPTQTPLQTMAGSGGKVENTFFEWQTDTLDPAGVNAKVEGEDYDSLGLQAVVPTVRLGNYCQISSKSCIVSGTNQATKKAGRGNEMQYNMAKRASELKRDIEFILLNPQPALAGTTAVARTTATLLAFVKTNVSFGATGVNPVYTNIPTVVRTDGTPRAFTEVLLKSVMQMVFTAGGDCTTIMLGPAQKQVFSTFAGIAQQRYNVKGDAPSTVIGAVDIYVGDFGQLHAVPNRFQRNRDAWLLDPEYIELRKLRDYRTEDLAKTGDATKKLLLTEWGFCVKNEAALGLVADLT